jgi:O-acetylserine/cysteine efflux transporter
MTLSSQAKPRAYDIGKNKNMPLKHIALALLAAVILGFNFVMIKVGLDSFPPIFLSCLRVALAAFPAISFLGKSPVAWR